MNNCASDISAFLWQHFDTNATHTPCKNRLKPSVQQALQTSLCVQMKSGLFFSPFKKLLIFKLFYFKEGSSKTNWNSIHSLNLPTRTTVSASQINDKWFSNYLMGQVSNKKTNAGRSRVLKKHIQLVVWVEQFLTKKGTMILRILEVLVSPKSHNNKNQSNRRQTATTTKQSKQTKSTHTNKQKQETKQNKTKKHKELKNKKRKKGTKKKQLK